jgi:probable rRNA maturation factor
MGNDEKTTLEYKSLIRRAQMYPKPPSPKHKISTVHSGVEAAGRLSVQLIKFCIKIALRYEQVDMPCEVNVLIVNDKRMRKMNLEFRGINKTTDVLSFPMQEFSPPGWSAPGPDAVDPETGLVPLGDIVISAECLARQAITYDSTLDQETVYLTIHSVLHLLGYDHVDEGRGKMLMRREEEKILQEIGYELWH